MEPAHRQTLQMGLRPEVVATEFLKVHLRSREVQLIVQWRAKFETDRPRQLPAEVRHGDTDVEHVGSGLFQLEVPLQIAKRLLEQRRLIELEVAAQGAQLAA